jgi:hypothetical protein
LTKKINNVEFVVCSEQIFQSSQTGIGY